MKKALLLVFVAVFFSCNSKNKEQKETVEVSVNQETTTTTESRYGKDNFAVVWNWKTTDKQLVEDNMIAIADEMNSLWKKGIMQDAYYNSDAKVDKFEYYPNISFFLKAESIADAEKILNYLILVKKGIASYTIYPVGTKWLDRKTEKINENGLTKSYVAVWNTVTKIDNAAIGELVEKHAQAQSNAVLDLWNDGIVENAYFDIEGTQKLNLVSDFVFFINTDSEEEAKKICESLPFFKNNMAFYHLTPVGVFWLGEYTNN